MTGSIEYQTAPGKTQGAVNFVFGTLISQNRTR